MHLPPNPETIGPTEMAREYLRNQEQQPLQVIKDMCTYAAMELSCEPDIRRGLKKHIYQYGVLKTQPTDKGRKELDVFHQNYRVKNVNMHVSQLQESDLFLEILHCQDQGLISIQISIEDSCSDSKMGNQFFEKLFQMF